jgi:predicted AlkP superfamily pyrophosphatase or phosphodiesterase
MKNTLFYLLIATILFLSCQTQTPKQEKPKLVRSIIIDQIRYDYLTRFSDRYGENGFKRLLNDSFSLENTHYNYIPTYTAVGHASIYTGTTTDFLMMYL